MEDAALSNKISNLMQFSKMVLCMARVFDQCVYRGFLFVARHLPYPCSFPEVIPKHAIGELPAALPGRQSSHAASRILG